MSSKTASMTRSQSFKSAYDVVSPNWLIARSTCRCAAVQHVVLRPQMRPRPSPGADVEAGEPPVPKQMWAAG
jgi:hypothetical protein